MKSYKTIQCCFVKTTLNEWRFNVARSNSVYPDFFVSIFECGGFGKSNYTMFCRYICRRHFCTCATKYGSHVNDTSSIFKHCGNLVT